MTGPGRRRFGLPVVVLAVVLVGLAVGGALWFVAAARARSRDALRHAATAYLADWERSDWTQLRAMVATPPADLTAIFRTFATGLRVERATFAAGGISIRGSTATAQFRARLDLSGLGPWTYTGRLPFVRTRGRWLVRWGPSDLHPLLRPGLHLDSARGWPARASIEARDGTPLTLALPVVTVGIELGRVKDRAQVIQALVANTGVSKGWVEGVLSTPGARPDWFLPVITLRRPRYEAVKPLVYPVPGLVFRAGVESLPRSEGLAQQVLGSTGPITAELLQRFGSPYVAGDVAGLAGLQLADERELAGRPGGEVRLLDATGRVIRVLARFPQVAGRPVRTTLDLHVQEAAERALQGISKPSALVAVDATSGDVLAVASRPTDEFNRAFVGQYPPGSTFKIVTAAALLASGLSPDAPITCPATVTVDGRTFHNFEHEQLGTITFAQAFARSCNTAFVQMAERLPPGALARMADRFGFNRQFSLPLPVAGGRFPSPADRAEQAAAAFGQGRVLASPLQMATVAAAVAGGAWRSPRLLMGAPTSAPEPLDSILPDLRQLMRLVVTEGTGTAANVPGEPVFGKTGTAEFGAGSGTHAWFVGYRGRLSFAVLVEGGGVGGQVAAPIAARFLEGL